MKVDILHSQTLPTNDLLNLPDIDGVFNEVKGPSVPQPSQTAPKTVQPNIHKPDDSWPVSYTHLDVYKRQA